MNSQASTLLLLMALAASSCQTTRVAPPPQPGTVVMSDHVKPDILMVVVDDLGWNDVGYSGGRSHLTPRIDAFARDAVFFDNAYSDAPNCAPSRCSMLTGLATPRHGVLTVGSSRRGKAQMRRIEPVPSIRFLSPDVTTLPDRLLENGYRTVHIGKFHVGLDPFDYGFSDQVAGSGLGHPKSYSSPYRNPALEDGPEGEYLTDRLADEAIRFMESDEDQPLFMHLSFFSVHTPIQPRSDLFEDSRQRMPEARRIEQRYDAMVSAVDEAFGRVLDVFETRRRPGMIIFTSDHGGYGPLADNGPLRGSKGMLYEGGIRVPSWSAGPEKMKAHVITIRSFFVILFRPSSKSQEHLMSRMISTPSRFPLMARRIPPSNVHYTGTFPSISNGIRVWKVHGEPRPWPPSERGTTS